jgi:hypothetical protein
MAASRRKHEAEFYSNSKAAASIVPSKTKGAWGEDLLLYSIWKMLI